MDTLLDKSFADNPQAKAAADIIQKCVHCGFCTATCPTYQLLGDEADSPRGRIYLIRSLLESGSATERTRTHLDRCLLCRSCETTCPSGVQYGRLIEAGRALLETTLQRPLLQKIPRKLVAKTLVQTPIISIAVKLGVQSKKLLPAAIKKQLPDKLAAKAWPAPRHARKMLVLTGCVQSSLSPETNLKTAEVLDKFGISLIQETSPGCCGAVGLHTSDEDMGMRHIRARIDHWWPQVEQNVEGILFTASGCGATIKDYGHLLKGDPNYAHKAERISILAKDISEVVFANIELINTNTGNNRSIVFHPPCTLQHGLKITDKVEAILTKAGYQLLPFKDSHLCCGSAGTYSIFQTDISKQLRQNKLNALQQNTPELITTANIGCQQHLKAKSDVSVVHWIEML